MENEVKKTSGLNVNLEKAEQILCKLTKTLESSIEKLSKLETELNEGIDIIDNVIKIIPQIRKLKARLDLEKALIKYNNALNKKAINRELINFVVQKRREIIASKSFKLNLTTISEIEKKLGVFAEDSIVDSDIFNKFRLLLTETKDLDEIEVIVRTVRLKLEANTSMKDQLKKDEIVRHFVSEAGFEEGAAVSELLLHKDLENALRDDVVTTKKLNKELRRIEGGFGQISNHIITSVNKKIKKIEEEIEIDKDGENDESVTPPPAIVKIFINYLVNPTASAAGVVGVMGIIIYSLGRFGVEPLRRIFPNMAAFFDATNITILCQMLNPQFVFIFCFGSIILGGFLKIMIEKIKMLPSS
jgi:hypothetical protein